MKILGVHLLTIFFLMFFSATAQTWIHNYTSSGNNSVSTIFEHYDKGYLLSGKNYLTQSHRFGWILKTDINGNKIWSKSFGESSSSSAFNGSKLTTDGGAILIGNTYEIYDKENPLIVKLNACGEKEWCKIYHSVYPYSWGVDIAIVPGGGYMALVHDWINITDNWLFRLDSLGDIIWQQAYATDTSFFWSPATRKLLETSDTCFLITGDAYSPDSLYPGYYLLKTMLIKVKSDGSLVFQLPWGHNNGINTVGISSIEDSKHNIYSAVRHDILITPTGDSPCILKTSFSGKSEFYKDLHNRNYGGISTTINWFEDSTLAVGSDFGSSWYNDTTVVFKTDSSGNVIGTKILKVGEVCELFGSDITFDNKLILAATLFASPVQVYAFKLNSDLEFDSIYMQPFTYDSLCPYPIVSDTIPLNDCSVVTSIFIPSSDSQKTKLHIYPNPAITQVTIELPQYLTRQNSSYGITATTYYHQWNSSTLEIYDLFGKLMYSKEIPKETEKVELDVSSWHEGMYVARVVFMNEVVATAKFVIE